MKVKVKANPFVITVDSDADGGAEHLLWTLTGFCVQLRKGKKLVCEGRIEHVDDKYILLTPWNNETKEFDEGQEAVFDYWSDDFDEVRYM
jgi:hypothetical protein